MNLEEYRYEIEEWCDRVNNNYRKWNIREMFLSQSLVPFNKTERIECTGIACFLMHTQQRPIIIVKEDKRHGTLWLNFTWSNTLNAPVLLSITREFKGRMSLIFGKSYLENQS